MEPEELAGSSSESYKSPFRVWWSQMVSDVTNVKTFIDQLRSILLFPTGNSKLQAQGTISIYLTSTPINVPEGWYKCAQFVIAVLNPGDPTIHDEHCMLLPHYYALIHSTSLTVPSRCPPLLQCRRAWLGICSICWTWKTLLSYGREGKTHDGG